MPRGQILVADDEAGVRDALDRALRFEGYEVRLFGDGAAVLAAVAEREPDAAVLDVTMPVLDGLETCRRLRTGGHRLPILMLTARDAVGDRVAGLDAGADDYLVKPFALEELLARVRALLRRSDLTAGDDPAAGDDAVLCFADVVMDRASRTVTRAGRAIELTRMEYSLLEVFLTRPGRSLTRGLLFELVWGYNLDGASKSLDVYIGYLRRKLEDGDRPRLLHTIRGVGFILREETGQ
ncbi:response regulator transcription factor [Dactylosporangium matsuzakiense]|uniref:DNA-binding response regulator n=1 Tax=Dactylosporangium matsuzakiense TaxID=53360 RepID=A0A9W6NMZ6_9ACTN|nr:response regulator transcription factor [Dactylosporangium matsuzakiense]UWZ43142.1 response regulator transcription factor [Dactylosporangium matsuzakiense]GLL02771.1 DNA-binding response regulator [Dactylosporangium matsuzakiense]